jgi:hypothetical protein
MLRLIVPTKKRIIVLSVKKGTMMRRTAISKTGYGPSACSMNSKKIF